MPTHAFGKRVESMTGNDADDDRCLGGREAAVEIDYPMTFTQTMLGQQGACSRNFNYVHCSGVLAEKDQTKPLWFLQEGRRAKVPSANILDRPTY